MKKITFPRLALSIAAFLIAAISVAQTTSIQVFDEVLFYDGYAGLVAEQDLYEPMPPEVLRHSNSRYAIQLTDSQLDMFGNKLTMDITLRAACDNYDRIARAYLAFVDKGATTYVSNNVERLEIGRFITPFMNKNISPMEVPFTFTADNIAEIFNDTSLRATYDFWIELDVFGVPYAAQTQVAGCTGRIDTFYGSLTFVTEEDASQTYPNANFVKTLACDENLNNYNATDVPGETTKIINFDLAQTVEDVTLYLVTSNHGANSGGEEYNRRNHFVYLDDALIQEYIPGGKSCEPFRQYNTQGNGIFSPSERTTRMWLSFSNWCPGDVIPIREIQLGTLTAGSHTIKLDVPDAVFVGGEGYIPVSMYLQNRSSFQETCIDPTEVNAQQAGSFGEMLVEWMENGDATQWEILYGNQFNVNDESFITVNSTSEILELSQGTYYSLYVRAICDNDFTSNWVGPVYGNTILNNEDFENNDFNFYPNPATSTVNLISKNLIDTVTLFDVTGKKVLSQTIRHTVHTLNIESIPSGVYFMNVNSEGTSETFKLIVN